MPYLPTLTLTELAALVRERPELLADARAELEARGTDVETPRRTHAPPVQRTLLEAP